MRRLRGTDGLRALACLMVMIYHLCQRMNPEKVPSEIYPLFNFLLTGISGLSIFFVLSGFLLAYPFWENYLKGDRMPDLKVYAVRRAGRIMPAFYVNLLFCFFIGVLLTPEAPALLLRYLAGITFTSGLHWLTMFPVELNGPPWSIGYEVACYLLMPLAMLGLFKLIGSKRSFSKAFAWWVGVFLVVLVLDYLAQIFLVPDDAGRGWQYGFVGGAKFWAPSYNIIGFFAHFCIGILASGAAAFLSQSSRSDNWTKKGVFDLLAAVTLAVWVGILWMVKGKGEIYFSILNQPCYFPVFTLVNGALLVFLTQSRWIGGIFDNPFGRFTAKISYGIYLWHMILMELFRAAFLPKFANFRMKDFTLWALSSLLIIAVSYLVASLSWFLMEKRILAKAHAWRPGQKAADPRKNRLVLVGVILVFVGIPSVTAFLIPQANNAPTKYFAMSVDAAGPVSNDPPLTRKVLEKGFTLTVHVKSIRPLKGSLVNVAVFRKGDFSNDTVVTEIPFEDNGSGQRTVVFQGLPPGEYAVGGFHDLNGNKKFDFTDAGLPIDGLISPSGKMPQAPPVFDEVKILFQGDTTLERPLFYFSN